MLFVTCKGEKELFIWRLRLGAQMNIYDYIPHVWYDVGRIRRNAVECL